MTSSRNKYTPLYKMITKYILFLGFQNLSISPYMNVWKKCVVHMGCSDVANVTDDRVGLSSPENMSKEKAHNDTVLSEHKQHVN